MATVAGGSHVVYAWVFGDGGYGSGASALQSYPAVGAYTALVTASDSANVSTATTRVTILLQTS